MMSSLIFLNFFFTWCSAAWLGKDLLVGGFLFGTRQSGLFGKLIEGLGYWSLGLPSTKWLEQIRSFFSGWNPILASLNVDSIDNRCPLQPSFRVLLLWRKRNERKRSTTRALFIAMSTVMNLTLLCFPTFKCVCPIRAIAECTYPSHAENSSPRCVDECSRTTVQSSAQNTDPTCTIRSSIGSTYGPYSISGSGKKKYQLYIL